jgi:anti-anti-sigma factor
MTIQVTRHDNAVVVAAGGRLDAVTAPQFGKQLQEVIDGGSTRVVVDFQELVYISSAGIRELIAPAKLLEQKGGQFCVANLSANVASVFTMCCLDRVLQIHGTVPQALAALA